MTKIIGLFEDKLDLACAVKRLYNRGFNQEEIEVIDPSPISQRRLMSRQDRRVAASVGPSFVSSVALPYNSPPKTEAEPRSIAVDPMGRLTSMGVPEAEACFYAVNVKRGNVLLIVQSYSERISTAQRIMDRANAIISSGYD